MTVSLDTLSSPTLHDPASLLDYFTELADPRREQGRIHQLDEIIFRSLGVRPSVRRVKGVDLQWVQIPPGIWVAPACSYRSDAGRKRNRRSLRDKRAALAARRADRP